MYDFVQFYISFYGFCSLRCSYLKPASRCTFIVPFSTSTSSIQSFIADLIGLSVTSDEGEELGVIDDVLQTGANDVYVVKKAR